MTRSGIWRNGASESWTTAQQECSQRRSTQAGNVKCPQTLDGELQIAKSPILLGTLATQSSATYVQVKIRDPNLPMTSDCAPTGITTLSSWLNDNGDVLGRRYVSELRRNYRR